MMPGKIVRAAIVGASSLLGKELAEVLNEPTSMQWDLKLLDQGSDAAQLTSAGDEAAVIQPLDEDAFAGVDIVFFAGDEQTTSEMWRSAIDTGASVVDLTGSLKGEPGVAVASPWVQSTKGNTAVRDLSTMALVSAHPAAVMLGLVLSKLEERFKVAHAAATVLEPASQAGKAGLDEMHSQTVSLLSFQSVPKEVFDAQVAFNFNVELGSAAKVDLGAVSRQIEEELSSIAGEELASRCTLQLVQAPVFNGYAVSMFVELDETVDAEALVKVLDGGIVSVPDGDEAAPSNQSATEEGKLLVLVRAANSSGSRGKEFWLWMAADNLRLAARNAVACATELLALRPGGRVQ